MTYKSILLPFTFYLFSFILTTLPSWGQTGSLSPYSRYGIGDLLQEGFTNQSGMGGIGAGLSSYDHINFINPASYVADTATIFEFGARGEIRQLELGDETSTQNSASFSHFSLGFPIIKNKLSAALGLLPYSSVGYNIVVEDKNVPNIGNVSYKYEGVGGINKVFVGAGLKLSKHLSGGINVSYLFGTYENVKSVEFPTGTNYFNSRYINGITVKGFYFNYGLLYEATLKNNLNFKAGLTGALSTKVSAANNQFYYNYVISSFGGEIVKDSIYSEKEQNGSIKMPGQVKFGFTFSKSKWLAGADFSYSNWDKYESFNSKDDLKNSYIINAGGERKAGKLVYRIGGRYAKTYLNLKNTQLDDYGVTFGIGLLKSSPKRPPSSINLSVELGAKRYA
ncbi:MAG: hypothetical protein IPP71_09055 [Bacteroidetes bacterium]|nr:hypothetical protein [Bacteroidota bacterium]